MKVCLISSGYIKSDPRYYFLANTFKQEGYEVSLLNIFLDPSHSAELLSPKDYKILLDYNVLNIDFYKYRSPGYVIKSPDYFYHYSHELIPIFVKNYIEKNNNESFLQSDLFYGLDFFWGGVIAQQFSQITKKTFIVDFKELFSDMGNNYPKESLNNIRNLEKDCISNALCIPCVSQKIIDFYQSKYIRDQKKFVLLENSRPFDYLTPNFSKEKKSKVRFIVSAGDANNNRGFNELAKIWEALNPTNAELDIRISNITEEQKNQIINISSKTHDKSLHLIPSVLEDRMTDSLLSYDCGIIPYLADRNLNQKYCCPNKFGQYLNAGLAIVSSNTDYISQKIIQNDLGVIYNPKDINDSIKIFRDLIDNPDQLVIKRINAHNFCKENYEWNNHIQPFLAIIKNYFVK